MPVIGDVLLACDLLETPRAPRGEEGVAVDLGVDLRQHELVGERQRGRVDLAAADHEHARLVFEQPEGVLERAGAIRALRAPVGVRA